MQTSLHFKNHLCTAFQLLMLTVAIDDDAGKRSQLSLLIVDTLRRKQTGLGKAKHDQESLILPQNPVRRTTCHPGGLQAKAKTSSTTRRDRTRASCSCEEGSHIRAPTLNRQRSPLSWQSATSPDPVPVSETCRKSLQHTTSTLATCTSSPHHETATSCVIAVASAARQLTCRPCVSRQAASGFLSFIRQRQAVQQHAVAGLAIVMKPPPAM